MLTAERRAPDADGPGPLGPVGEGVGDDRHRHRVEHRPADGLHHPERHQPAQAGRQAAQQRADGERGQADLEDPAAADPVRGRRRTASAGWPAPACSASTLHCRPDTEACRSRRMDGSATFTIVLSSPTMNRLMQQMASTSRRRRRLSSGRAVHLDRGFRSACDSRDACVPTGTANRPSNPAQRAGLRPGWRGGLAGANWRARDSDVDHEALTCVPVQVGQILAWRDRPRERTRATVRKQ